jgi:hypothetical protein
VELTKQFQSLGLVLLVLDEKQTFDALQQSRMTFELVDEHQTVYV